MVMAEWRLVFYGVFEPFELAAAVALIILSCVIAQRAGKLVSKPAAVFREKITLTVTSFSSVPY